MAGHGFILRGGTVMDGSGRSGFRADVAIDDDRIAAVGGLSGRTADTDIDVTGQVVAPGFIDVHTHDDRMVRDAGDMTPKVSQGVTTVVAGNCGISLAPLVADERPMEPFDLIGLQDDFRYPTYQALFDELDRAPAACNAAFLVGHGTLRLAAMDDVLRPATVSEIETMKEALDEAMAAGAIGLSTGLEYPPARCCETAEVVELASRAAAAGGVYATHMRSYAGEAKEAFDEAVHIGRKADIPVIVSHFHCHDHDNPELAGEALEWFARSRREGVRIIADAYPYEASSTSILPEFVERRTRVLVTWSKPHPDMGGRYLDEIADDWEVDALTAARRLAPGGAIYFGRDERNVERLMAHPDILIGSDGIPLAPHPHPRLWGTFPHVLGHYVREIGLTGLENAIHRMTGASAEWFGLEGRGRVAAGAWADLVVFDPAAIASRATYMTPEKPSAGIGHVFVNGIEVWNGGGHTGARPGRIVGRGENGGSRP